MPPLHPSALLGSKVPKPPPDYQPPQTPPPFIQHPPQPQPKPKAQGLPRVGAAQQAFSFPTAAALQNSGNSLQRAQSFARAQPPQQEPPPPQQEQPAGRGRKAKNKANAVIQNVTGRKRGRPRKHPQPPPEEETQIAPEPLRPDETRIVRYNPETRIVRAPHQANTAYNNPEVIAQLQRIAQAARAGQLNNDLGFNPDSELTNNSASGATLVDWDNATPAEREKLKEQLEREWQAQRLQNWEKEKSAWIQKHPEYAGVNQPPSKFQHRNSSARAAFSAQWYITHLKPPNFTPEEQAAAANPEFQKAWQEQRERLWAAYTEQHRGWEGHPVPVNWHQAPFSTQYQKFLRDWIKENNRRAAKDTVAEGGDGESIDSEEINSYIKELQKNQNENQPDWVTNPRPPRKRRKKAPEAEIRKEARRGTALPFNLDGVDIPNPPVAIGGSKPEPTNKLRVDEQFALNINNDFPPDPQTFNAERKIRLAMFRRWRQNPKIGFLVDADTNEKTQEIFSYSSNRPRPQRNKTEFGTKEWLHYQKGWATRKWKEYKRKHRWADKDWYWSEKEGVIEGKEPKIRVHRRSSSVPP